KIVGERVKVSAPISAVIAWRSGVSPSVSCYPAVAVSLGVSSGVLRRRRLAAGWDGSRRWVVRSAAAVRPDAMVAVAEASGVGWGGGRGGRGPRGAGRSGGARTVSALGAARTWERSSGGGFPAGTRWLTGRGRARRAGRQPRGRPGRRRAAGAGPAG